MNFISWCVCMCYEYALSDDEDPLPEHVYDIYTRYWGDVRS